jgi:cytochrome c551/c552
MEHMANLPFRSTANRSTEVNAEKQANPSKATIISDTACLLCHKKMNALQKPSNKNHTQKHNIKY